MLPNLSPEWFPYVVLGVSVCIFAFVAWFVRPRSPRTGLTGEYEHYKLLEKHVVSHNVRRFRFALQSPATRLGLPVGGHIMVKAHIDGKDVSRPYTPVTLDSQLGYFDLVIKIYPQGLLSRWLDSQVAGAMVNMRGPIGLINYLGNGTFKLNRHTQKTAKHVGLVCGGTGITPCLRLMYAIKEDTTDQTHVSLIFANVSEDDILLRKEIEALGKLPRFSVFFSVDKPTPTWKGGAGFVSADMLQQNGPAPSEDTLFFLCGPPPMTNSVTAHLLKLGHAEMQIWNL